jgi:hypothetical protein
MEKSFRAENRFRFYHYCFYIGGVPLFKSAVTNFYYVYSFLCSGCCYMTLIAMFMDIYHNLEDWDHIIDVAMLFFLFACEMFAQIYFR